MASREDKGQKGMTQSLHFFWHNISFITLITMPGSYLALHSPVLKYFVNRGGAISPPARFVPAHHTALPMGSVTAQLHILFL